MATSYPGSAAPQPPVQYQPHHGRLVLVLGITSIVFAITCIIGLATGLIAFLFGGQDIQAMDRGIMDPRGRGNVNTGRICGLIGLCLSVVALPFIAIVGAIVFPVFATARARAVQSSCLNNEKQVVLAFQMYAVDHNNKLPNASTWAQDLQPYLGSSRNPNRPDIFHCPADKSGARSSYAMNAALSEKDVNKLTNPAQVVLIFETNRPGNSPSGGPEALAIPGRHNRGNDYGFADGHVTWERMPPSFAPVFAPATGIPH